MCALNDAGGSVMKMHPRTLGELLDGLVPEQALSPHRDRPISGIFDDSRRVTTDGVFVALQGASADGRRFIGDAVARGAAFIIGEDDDDAGRAIMLRVRDARATLARAAQRWYGLDMTRPAGLQLIGVTGTNGKSTTAMMTRAIMEAGGKRTGLLGTVLYDLCTRKIEADMTTPAPLRLAEYLAECAQGGATAAVMEVSSHALDQRRVDGLRFAAAGFTNLTGDHLDYHKTMDNYAAAKRRLFETLDVDGVAVVNRDDPWHKEMIRDCKGRVVTYSLSGAGDITATLVKDSIKGTLYRTHIDGVELALENPIVGKHNVYNALCAAGMARACGASHEAIRAGLQGLRNVPGRLQRVPCGLPADVFVDYAHSDDALKNVLSVLRPLTKGRLVVVFGCGGNRDRTKRPRMANVAESFADAIIVTSDNPRNEKPADIIQEIMTGFGAEGRRRVIVESDRRRAICAAIATSRAGDVILIAGKGHENYQIVGDSRTHFDDAEVAIQAAAAVAGQERGGA